MEQILPKLLLVLVFLLIGFVFGFLSRQVTIINLRQRVATLKSLADEKEAKQPERTTHKEVTIDVHYENRRIVDWYFNGVSCAVSSTTTPFEISQYFSKWYCAHYNVESFDDSLPSLVRRINDATETKVTASYNNHILTVSVNIFDRGKDGTLTPILSDTTT